MVTKHHKFKHPPDEEQDIRVLGWLNVHVKRNSDYPDPLVEEIFNTNSLSSNPLDPIFITLTIALQLSLGILSLNSRIYKLH